MNKAAIIHIQDSPYSFPTDTHSMVIRLRTAKNDMTRVSLIYESKYVIWESQKTLVMEKAYTDELFDWYEARLVLEDTRLAYVFFVEKGKEAYYFCEEGLLESYDYKLGYYNFFQYPYINEADIARPVEWMKTSVFYQIFVDRFNRGITDKKDSYINCKWGDEPTPRMFAGGDIPGITQKLDYIKELGITALYLTPVFTSISNHKYDISDYYTVDPQFGSNEDLRELVRECHSRGMRIVLDAVFNHVSDRCEQFRDVVKNGRSSRFYNWFIIHGDKIDSVDCNYETFASCAYMPKFDTSNPEVQEYLRNIAVHYIKEYDIDGWRLDVADEVSQDFWRSFRKAVKEAKGDAVIIGEDWHDAYRNLRGDQYDSIMNYAFTKVLLDFYVYNSINARQAAYRLNDLMLRNKEGINRNMLNLLDSHDTARFFEQLGGDRRRMKQALAMLYFYMGTPCIFYGTELLTVGGHDPGCRQCMDWDKAYEQTECEDIVALLKSLAELKKKEPLNEGLYRFYEKNGMLVMSSNTEENSYVLYVNHTPNRHRINNIIVKPESFVITKNGGELIHE